jgi:hypothetical protein
MLISASGYERGEDFQGTTFSELGVVIQAFLLPSGRRKA